jgi:hypothetical protein
VAAPVGGGATLDPPDPDPLRPSAQLGLFEFLSRNLRGTPVALVGTVRTDEPDAAGFLAW